MTPTHRPRPLRRELMLGAAAVAIASLAIYSVIAIFNQSLSTGSTEQIVPGTVRETALTTETGPIRLLDYAPGASVTVNQSLDNTGSVNVTITGVELSLRPPDWMAIFSIADARVAVPAAAQICCGDIDEAATWSANRFSPLQLSPGQEGAVALRLTINNCKGNDGGGYESLDSIKVHYTVLGFPHVQEVALSRPVGFKVPLTCPA